MRFEEKNNITIYERLIKSRIFFVFLIPMVVALLIGIFQEIYQRYQVKKDLDKLNAEIVDLNKQKDDLGGLIDYYKNESNLEREARLRLNLKKTGERAVIILSEATSTNESRESIFGSNNSGIDNLPNYKQWWYYFFGK